MRPWETRGSRGQPTRGRGRGRGRGIFVRDSMGSLRSPPTTMRAEKSLGLLTERFVQLLQDAKNGTLDLRQVLFVCYPFLHD